MKTKKNERNQTVKKNLEEFFVAKIHFQSQYAIP